ncbi:MAG TPA: type II secretion system F family protein [Amycolatopsis sp.]|nr:type II secretion system F family protein [Amycolatopsis sp.]
MTGAVSAVAVGAAALLVIPDHQRPGKRLARLGAKARRSVRPVVAARFRRRSRADSPRLATTWDLLAACLRAGLPVPVAIRAVVEELAGPEADALRAAADLLALGAGPAEAWALARACPGTAPLARAAMRTARSGTALAEVADELASALRFSAAEHAEARAQRAGVLIAGPLGLCFLPAFLCLGVVPVVLGLAGRLAVP